MLQVKKAEMKANSQKTEAVSKYLTTFGIKYLCYEILEMNLSIESRAKSRSNYF